VEYIERWISVLLNIVIIIDSLLNIFDVIKGGLFKILDFVNNYTNLAGVIISLFTATVWFQKYIKQKRAEAFFGFYAELSFRIKSFRLLLEERGQLDVSNSQNGNIYALIYKKDKIVEVCPAYSEPNEYMLNIYKEEAKDLKNLLVSTKENVYPKWCKRNEWYDNLQIIFSFCEFLEREIFYQTNVSDSEDKKECKHMIKCRELVDALNYIEKAVSKAKY
jgi:hypothetical protein